MVRTLKSYCVKKYDEYLMINYNDTRKYLSIIMKKSETDPRLALLAQSFYYAKGDDKTASKFIKFTGESYKNYNSFINSKNKYVYQFNERMASVVQSKIKLKKMISSKIKKAGLSYYQIYKEQGISRSKLNDFFKYEKLNVFSVKKLIEINKILNIKY